MSPPVGSSEPMSPSGQAGQYCLDDFELIRVIGRGSYAKVLMVELKKTKRIYAMKVIKKTLVTDDEVHLRAFGSVTQSRTCSYIYIKIK